MRECERQATSEYSIPSLLLMENAGRSVADAIEKYYKKIQHKTFLIFCGKGNNGGDGFVVARHLFNRGANVHILLVGEKPEIKGYAKTNLAIVSQLQKKINNTSRFSFHEITKHIADYPSCDFIIDALFGTGFNGYVRAPYTEIIQWMNESGKPIIAIDIPSGINSETGIKTNIAVKAQLTITMAVKKTGLLLNDGNENSGTIVVADIAIPNKLIEEHQSQCSVTDKDISSFLPQRKFNVHKYSVGKVFVLAGSKKFPGAASMNAISTLRAGAGATLLGTVQSLFPLLVTKMNEVMLVPLNETHEGTIAFSAYDTIMEKIQWCDVVAIGPGISRDEETQQLLQKIISSCTKPTVIDADGLLAWNKQRAIMKETNCILTPHSGELATMLEISDKEIECNRIAVVQKAAKELNAIILLKGNPTIIATQDGKIFFNPTGNAGMATAGSGDVLTGIIAGLLAQMIHSENTVLQTSLLNATLCGAYLHGLAGDIAKEKLGIHSLMAMDIVEFLPQAILSVQ